MNAVRHHIQQLDQAEITLRGSTQACLAQLRGRHRPAQPAPFRIGNSV